MMKKFVITKEKLNRFDGDKGWAISSEVLDLVDGRVMMEYESAEITENHVKLFDSNGRVIDSYEYEVEE